MIAPGKSAKMVVVIELQRVKSGAADVSVNGSG